MEALISFVLGKLVLLGSGEDVVGWFRTELRALTFSSRPQQLLLFSIVISVVEWLKTCNKTQIYFIPAVDPTVF